KMAAFVDDATRKGARTVYAMDKGAVPTSGHFFGPIVMTGVTRDMDLYQNEIFGPICGIVKFESEAELISIVNDGINVGLAGYFYSNHVGRIMRVSEAIDVGMVGVNTGLISSEVSPFGGVKESGSGREGSKHGIGEYLNIKSVSVNY
ncbi:Succinate-semialdehyde dehydrogenase, mitochondrial, partial [Smittium mucronatum]